MAKAPHQPLYRHIAEDMRLKIAERRWTPDAAIPAQLQLAKLYGVNDFTVRKALELLVHEGLIVRIKKKGSFVLPEAAAQLARTMAGIRHLCFVYRGVSIRLLTQGFYQTIIEGVQEACRASGAVFSMVDAEDEWALPKGQDVGYILFGQLDMPQVEHWLAEEQRMVTVQYGYPHLPIPSVVGDNVSGGYQATQHLLALGHRRIGIILTGKNALDINVEFALRLQGYRMALDDYGVAFDPALVVVMDTADEIEQSGYDGYNQLSLLADRPTAIFAGNDYKALGVIKAARERGQKVPEDLSVIGYDGQPFAEQTIPRLSTVNQNTFQYGKQAAELLLGQAFSASNAVQVAPQLVIRESTASFAGIEAHRT